MAHISSNLLALASLESPLCALWEPQRQGQGWRRLPASERNGVRKRRPAGCAITLMLGHWENASRCFFGAAMCWLPKAA